MLENYEKVIAFLSVGPLCLWGGEAYWTTRIVQAILCILEKAGD